MKRQIIPLYGRTRICFLAIVNVTYVTQSLGNHVTHTKWYFMFSDHRCLRFLINKISDHYNFRVCMILPALLIWFLSTETMVHFFVKIIIRPLSVTELVIFKVSSLICY